MGRPMVRNLLKAGFDVTVNSRTTGVRGRDGRARRETRAASPAEAAAATDMVITMVPDSADVEAVAQGPGGVFEGAHAGLIIADMSTISPAVTQGACRPRPPAAGATGSTLQSRAANSAPLRAR